jgi:DNA-binding response OmpR family regulator
MTAVLLVEDDVALREVLAEALRAEGHVVQICRNPAELTDHSLHRDDTVAVVDAWGTSHLELLEPERLSIEKLASALPTIMVTGRAWAEQIDAVELGLLALLPKPADLENLLALVGAVRPVERTTL